MEWSIAGGRLEQMHDICSSHSKNLEYENDHNHTRMTQWNGLLPLTHYNAVTTWVN